MSCPITVTVTDNTCTTVVGSTSTNTAVTEAGTTVSVSTNQAPVATSGNGVSISAAPGSNIIVNGGGGAIDIYDEGNLSCTGVTGLNFIGGLVYTECVGNGIANIYIDAATYSSKYTANSISTTNRRISSPCTNTFSIGNWNGGDFRNTTRSSTLQYTKTGFFSIENLYTYLVAKFISGDDSTPIAFLTGNLTGDQDITQNGIRIKISGFQIEGIKYKANSLIEFYPNQIFSGGRFSIDIKHYNGTGIHTVSQGALFFDPDNVTASHNSLSISPTVGLENIKYLSAVKYYTTGTYFTVDINDIDNINNLSFPLIQETIVGSNLGLNTLQISGEQLTNWDTCDNDINSSYFNDSWIVSNNGICTTGNERIYAYYTDWSNSSNLYSPYYNYMVNTLTATETRLYDDFNNENLRLTTGFTTWDSTKNINTYSGGLGLQIGCSRIIYPQYNYITRSPAGSPNYSALVGDRYYIRRFNSSNGTTSSNGRFTLGDTNITDTDIINSNVLIDVTPDSGANWFTLNSDYLGGIINNGDGCRVYTNNPTFPQLDFTFGQNKFSDVVIFKITIKNSHKDKYLGSITLSNGNWAS